MCIMIYKSTLKIHICLIHCCTWTITFVYRNIVQTFKDMLGEAAAFCGSPLVVFIDGLDLMEPANQPSNLEWLPSPMPMVRHI